MIGMLLFSGFYDSTNKNNFTCFITLKLCFLTHFDFHGNFHGTYILYVWEKLDYHYHTSLYIPSRIKHTVCLPFIHLLIIPSSAHFCSTFVSLYVHYVIHQWIFWHWWLSSLICYCVFTLIHHYCMHHLESEFWINYTIYRLFEQIS